MQQTMKALVKTEPMKGAVLTEIPVPPVGPGQLLVRVKAAAICGTDIHIFAWTKFAQDRIKTPMVFGHEFAGEVVEVGPGVKGFAPGDHVAGETHLPCGQCELCRTGRQHICQDMKILGVQVPGVFSEYAVIPQEIAWRIPLDLPFETAAVYEPTGVAVHAVSTADVRGKDVLVTGCGPIGLAACETAKALGARRVVATDRSAFRLKLASEFGVDVPLDVSRVDLKQEGRSLTGGLGFDVVVEASGNPAAIQDGFAAVRRGGSVVLFGLAGEPVALDLTNDVIYKETVVHGVTGRRMWDTWYL
ncbi:MAG: alcohol dehydrogenase catalytic domain-containing protein, partial [Bacteroidota bacterium]